MAINLPAPASGYIQAIIGQNQDEKKPRERGKRRDKIKNRQKA
jgi:hypothetical protein